METKTSSSLRCADGTEIGFDWVYPDAPDYEWMRDRSHWPQPATPMELWLRHHAWPGADRAWDELRMTPPPMFYRFQFAGPFLYVRMTQYAPERLAEIAPRYVEVSREFGGALGFWTDYCEPRISRSCDELASLDHSADLAAAAELWAYGFHQTFTSLAPLFIGNMRMAAILAESFKPEEIELIGFEVTQGGDNATQDIDAAIWGLAEIARATPPVAKILASDRDDHLAALRQEAAAASFVQAFDALIARHGRRSQAWQLTAETWAEQPAAALALVRAQVSAERTSPDELRERSARRRREATERVLAALPAEKHDEFRGIVDSLAGYVQIREGRAYWQLVASGAMRGLLLRIGAQLVRDGRLDSTSDVLYLVPDDLAAGGAVDLRERAAKGRSGWERACRLETPFIIGTPGEVAAQTEARRSEFRGAPASRGQATGRARILHSPDEGARLTPGDILVCVMTSPAWTPLFAIAGGIVTETGGPLSHPAITAREYGIPAVLALHDATKMIEDGQVITIDGGAGTVSIARADSEQRANVIN